MVFSYSEEGLYTRHVLLLQPLRLLIFVTLDGKTYTNDFPFSNGFLFTSRLCQPFERLGHPFVEDIRLFKQLCHLYYGISLNLLSNDMHGRRVRLFIQKNSLVRVVI